MDENIETKLLTVKQFLKPDKWPCESALRGIILDASWGRNNFKKAFTRVGRRVFINPVEFWKCVNGREQIER